MKEETSQIPKLFFGSPDDEKILSYYKKYFETVYVLLHPFIRPTNIPVERFCPKDWPTKQEIIEGCEAVKWQDIIKISGLNNYSEIDVGLRTRIRSLNKNISHQLLTSIHLHNIIQPPEGDLPPLLENRLYESIKKLGYNKILVLDEFGTESKLNQIDFLMTEEKIPSHGSICTEDFKLLVSTHWDSHYSFLCSSKKIIEKILSLESFEGFYCTEKTEVYWSAYETKKFVG